MAKACKRTGGDITPEWLLSECKNRSSTLLVVTEGEPERVIAAMVARVDNWGDSGKKVFNVLAMTGESLDWFEHIITKKWLDNLDCKSAVFSGPLAYKRLVKGARMLRAVFEVEF
jgi:hypothetical protein